MENWAVLALVISWVLFVPLVYYYITKGNDEEKRRLRESAEKEAIERQLLDLQNQHTSEVRRLNGEVVQLNGEVGRLNGEVGRLNREVGRLNGEAKRLNEEVGRLEDEKAELEIKLQDQSRELRDQKNNYRSLRSECNERKKKAHRLRIEHQKLEARFDNLTAEKAKVDSEYNELLIANGAQNHECIYKQEHQRRVEDYQRLVEVLRQKERDLRQKDEDLRQKDEDLRQKDAELRRERMKFIQQQNHDQATNSFLMWDQVTGNMCNIDPYDFFPYERDGRTRPRAMAELARPENQRYEVQNAYYGEGAQPICMVTGDNVDKLGSNDDNRVMRAYFERRREELGQYCPSRVNSIDLSITSPSFTSPSADVSNHSLEAPSMMDEVKICSACHKRKGKNKYSKNQWGKRRKARCKSCLETES